VTDDLDGRRRDEVGRLTLAAPSEFVTARDARVKELKAADEPELARVLAAQRRPTVPAWAVDQLAHHHGDELEALFAAADRLRATQSAATSERASVRAASADFSAQVRRLRSLAEQRLADSGTPPEAHLDEVEATLLAAATDADVAADVRAGALLRPAPSPGFTALASLSGPPRASRSRPVAPDVEPRSPEPDGDDSDPAASDAEVAAQRAAELEAIAARREDLTSRRRELDAAADRAGQTAGGARARAERLRSEAERLLQDATSADEEAARADEEGRRARDGAAAVDDALAGLDEQERQLSDPAI
jgi:hypothetical protein